MVFRIKPLEWKCFNFADGSVMWEGQAVFCNLYVEHDDEGCRWKYCVDEFYDEDSHDCDSVDTGKAAAEEWYLGRLMPALEPAAATAPTSPPPG